MKELENCLKKLDRRVSRKRRNWVTQQKAEVNNLELRSRRGANVGEIAAGVLRNEMRPSSCSIALMAKLFSRTEGQFLFAWYLTEVALKDLSSCDNLKYGTIACMCTGSRCSMSLHAAFDSTPERRAKTHK